MNISVEKQPHCKAILKAEIPADAVSAERNKIVANYLQHAPIKGFRKGKVPRAIVEKKFSREISDELSNNLFEAATREVFTAEPDLKVLDFGSPESLTLNSDGTASISSELLIVPNFDLPEYKGIAVSIPSSTPSDEDIQKSVDTLLDQNAEYEIEETALADGNVAVIDFTTTMADGSSVAEAAGREVGFLNEAKSQWIAMQEDSFLPGFNEQLIGKKAGEEVSVKVTVPEGFPIAELVGKELLIDVKILEVRIKKTPEFNDEFASKVFSGATADRLREMIKFQVSMGKRQEADSAKVDQIVDKLVSGMDFEIPDNIVESEVYGLMQQRLNALLSSGNLGANPQETVAKLREDSRADAERNVRAHFILQEIARKEGLSVDDNELYHEIVRMAEQAKTPVKAYVTRLRKEGRLNSIRLQILTAKTLGRLVELASLTYEDPQDDPANQKSEEAPESGESSN